MAIDSIRMRKGTRRIRVVIEGIGIVDIDRGLHTADGKPRLRVDVISDFDRFGPAPDGLRYVVENGEPGPGVVFVTGEQPEDSPHQPTTIGGETLCKRDGNDWPCPHREQS